MWNLQFRHNSFFLLFYCTVTFYRISKTRAITNKTQSIYLSCLFANLLPKFTRPNTSFQNIASDFSHSDKLLTYPVPRLWPCNYRLTLVFFSRIHYPLCQTQKLSEVCSKLPPLKYSAICWTSLHLYSSLS